MILSPSTNLTFDAARFGRTLKRNAPAWHGHRFQIRLVTTADREIRSVRTLVEHLQAEDCLAHGSTDSDLLGRMSMLAPSSSWLSLSSHQNIRTIHSKSGTFSSLRQEIFAAHFLPSVPVGHQCARLHGHNFVIEPVLLGGAGEETLALQPFLLHEFQRRLLNDLPGLGNPTSENLAISVLEKLERKNFPVVAVRVQETVNCGCVVSLGYRLIQIYRDFRFESALAHDDNGVYGHSFLLRVHMRLHLDDEMGWTIDYAEIKRMVEPLIDCLDHHDLQIVTLPDGEVKDLSVLPALASEIYLWLRQKSQDRVVMIELQAHEGEGFVVHELNHTPGAGLWLL